MYSSLVKNSIDEETPLLDRLPKIPWFSILTDQGIVTPAILKHSYDGAGTQEDPYLVTYLDNDPRDPIQFPSWLRWMLCLAAGYGTFSVAFISSAYASGIPAIARDLESTQELSTLGLSVFVVGFVFGPFAWAPTSELFGRQYIFIFSLTAHVVLNIAICYSTDLISILVLRFLSGAFGAAPLTNAGGVIADTFPPKTRGLAITVYALVPLLALTMGPIVGGSVVDALGWRWLMGVMAMLSASALAITLVLIPETFAPVLLRKRAERLSDMTGRVYVSAVTIRDDGEVGFLASMVRTLSRPFLLAVHEPIIVLLALYQAIVIGILYLTLEAFPIVYGGTRGWSQKEIGLSFLGVLVGTLCSVLFQLWDNHHYVKLLKRLEPGTAPPEARLFGCCVGSVSIVIGLFWFAWTSGPSMHCLVSIAAGIPFGFGVVLVTIGATNYLIDAYTIFAASALTVCFCGRAVLGATFPLLARSMYENLGIHWGSSVPAFLALACSPFPFFLYRYGPEIRARCKFAGQAEKSLQMARIYQNERLVNGHETDSII